MEVGTHNCYFRNEFREQESLFDYSMNKYYQHHSRERNSRLERKKERGGSDRYNNALKSDNSKFSVSCIEVDLPLKKKPKFSPVVWDSEEKKENRTLKHEATPIGLLLPPVDKCSRKFSSVASHNTDQREVVDTVTVTATGYNILASRWMEVEEGELVDEEEMHTEAVSIRTPRSSEASTSSRVLTPELGDGREIHRKLCENDDPDSFEEISSRGSDIDVKGSYDKGGILEPPLRHTNYFSSCRSVYEFEKLKKIGSGTYGVVYQARDKRSGEIVALKKVKMEKETEGFPITSMREINILSSLYHPSIVNLKEVVVEDDVNSRMGDTYLVMEYMEHDLSSLINRMKYPFSQSEVKCLMLQLFEGVRYLHENWVLHRDLKTSNILLNNCGELKICDFGLSREYGNPLKPYTALVISLYYRPPELLLGAEKYSTAVDMWSLGCIMAELLAKKPLFCGKSELDQLDKIFETLGTPSEMSWPGFSSLPGANGKFRRQSQNLLSKKFPPASFTGAPFLSSAGFDLLSRLLSCDPKKRITAEEAVSHQWFREVPLPKEKEFMPTFPPQYS